MRAFVFVVLALVGDAVAEHEIYKGCEVYEVTFETEGQLAEFRRLEGEVEARAAGGAAAPELDVWSDAVLGLRNASVMVAPQRRSELLALLERLGAAYTLRVPDVATYFQERDAEWQSWRSQRSGRLVPFQDYPRYAEVDEYLERIAAEYPSLVTLINAGQSFEGRDIKYLRISTTNFTDSSKPVFYLDAMIHAREWVTTPVAIYTVHRLVEDLLSEDQDLLDDIDWIVMPIVNPDGYEFTHTTTRLWRKTRSNLHTGADACPGIDANRNFDFEFATLGVSTNPCGETFPGDAAFSEPETAIVRDILFEHLTRIQVYLNIHSYGNWVLFGYGNASLPANAVTLHHVGAALGSAMDARKLPQAPYYLVGNSALLLYPTSGSAQDYAQSIGVPFSYTLELPGYGYFFQVPPQYIQQINEETWSGISAAARLSVLYYRARLASGQ